MLDPKFFTNPNRMRHIRSLMIEPCPLARPKQTITNWGIIIDDVCARRMRGISTGCSEFENTTVITAPVWQLRINERLIRTSETWITLGRGYHEDVPLDLEIDAIGPRGYFLAPCVCKQYLENVLQLFDLELAKV